MIKQEFAEQLEWREASKWMLMSACLRESADWVGWLLGNIATDGCGNNLEILTVPAYTSTYMS